MIYGDDEFAEVLRASVIYSEIKQIEEHFWQRLRQVDYGNTDQNLDILARMKPVIPPAAEVALVRLWLPVRTKRWKRVPL